MLRKTVQEMPTHIWYICKLSTHGLFLQLAKEPNFPITLLLKNGSIFILLPKYSFVYLQKNLNIDNTKLHIEQIKEWFERDQVFDNKQIASFYRSIEPNTKESTVNWRIYSLVQMGVLTRVGRGKFVLGNKNSYTPDIPPKLKTLNNRLKRSYPFLDYCLWTSALFNEFMLHQPGKFFLIVEVEKDAMESIFFFMKENKYSVFLEPTKELLNRYIPEEKETWVVKSLVSEAPLQNISGIQLPTIEKLLVDLFCDTVVLDAQQGTERDRIFEEVFEKYTVNENKMLRYADRRRKKKEFNEYLNKISKFRQQI